MADAGTTPDVPVVIDGDVIVEFNEASSRQQINSGESVKTLFGKIRKFLTDLKAVAFSGAYSDLSGAPDLSVYALKSKYGDTTINVGRKAGTDVGVRSTAEGYGNTANGNYSHAEGEFTTASGGYSHAEGIHTTASGEMSHAEGNETTASGANSHAEGFETTASGLASHAGGTGTKALHDNEVAYGKYNKSNADTVFSVGDGTADDARHNAFEITTTGGKLHDKDIATTDLIPTKLPANGGNANTVNGHSVNSDVPENAKFTDTIPDLSPYAKKTDIPTELPANGGNADTINGRHCGRIATLSQDGHYWNTSAEDINDAYLQWDGSNFFRFKTYGGNLIHTDDADTVDGLHADDFVKANDKGQISIPNNVDVPVWIDTNGKRFQRYTTNSGNTGLTNVPDNSTDYVWYWYDGLNILARDYSSGKYYICDMINGIFSGWKDVYTSGYKPYISGSATVAANSTTCTSNHGFTPSAVIWWDGNSSGVAVSFNDTQFAINNTSAVDRTVNYLIFK